MAIINDGSVVGFSRIVAISGVNYVADDFKFDIPSGVTFVRTNQRSEPTGQVFVKGVTTGSATLQLETAATIIPQWGDSFDEDEGTFIVTQVGRAETKDGETKVPISFSLAITADIVAS